MLVICFFNCNVLTATRHVSYEACMQRLTLPSHKCELA